MTAARIQSAPISYHKEWTQFMSRIEGKGGAVVSFTGVVREFTDDAKVDELFIEHYPEMTESSIDRILENAHSKWDLLDSFVIHRVGQLKARELIVLVFVGSRHRADAFSACEFIVDFLKTDAIFWKKESRSDGSSWLESFETDYQRSQHWE